MTKTTDTKDPGTIKGNLEESVIIMEKQDIRKKIAGPEIRPTSELDCWTKVIMNGIREVASDI